MSRPSKAVVDYFPHYVNHGRTMFTIESKYGNDGYAFWFKLLELLGASEHHYIDCNNVESWEFLIAKTRVSEEIVTEILDLLSKLGSIDKELWQCKIIRSDNFITNLSSVYKRREVKVLNNSEVMSLCIQKPPVKEVIVDINPQRKEKKRIVKESKEYYADFVSMTNDEYSSLVAKVGEDGAKRCIEILDNYKGSTGKKYKSDYRTILNWVVQRYQEEKSRKPQGKPQSGNIFLEADV